MKYKKRTSTALKIVIYVVCICLAILSILPFWIMIVNATRSTTQIQQHAISMIPSGYMMRNLSILLGKSFNPMVGFMNFADYLGMFYRHRGVLFHNDGLRAGGI